MIVPPDPISGFVFAVSVDVETAPARTDGLFREVSGIGPELESEAIAEGGENRFVNRLPTGRKRSNLVLKHGHLDRTSPLVAWASQVVASGIAQSVHTRSVYVSLLDPDKTVMRAWRFTNAYPVYFDIDGRVANGTDIEVEKIEFAYAAMARVV